MYPKNKYKGLFGGPFFVPKNIFKKVLTEIDRSDRLGLVNHDNPP